MDKKLATSIAVKGLGNKQHSDDIRRKLCSYGTMTWEEAEELIQETRRKHAVGIALRRQSSMFLFLAFVGFIAGLYLMLINGKLLVDFGWPTPFFELLEGYDLPYGVAYGSNNLTEFYGGALLSILSVFGFFWALLLKL